MTQVTYAEEIISLDPEAKKIVIKRHIDGGVETVEAPLPLVVTVNGSAAPCRPANAKRIMANKKAEIAEWNAQDINCDMQQVGKTGSPTNVKKVENIVFKAKESRTMSGSDEEINTLMQELINEKIIG